MVYARVRTGATLAFSRVGGWKAGNNPACTRSRSCRQKEPLVVVVVIIIVVVFVVVVVVVVIFLPEAIRLICESEV